MSDLEALVGGLSIGSKTDANGSSASNGKNTPKKNPIFMPKRPASPHKSFPSNRPDSRNSVQFPKANFPKGAIPHHAQRPQGHLSRQENVKSHPLPAKPPFPAKTSLNTPFVPSMPGKANNTKSASHPSFPSGNRHPKGPSSFPTPHYNKSDASKPKQDFLPYKSSVKEKIRLDRERHNASLGLTGLPTSSKAEQKIASQTNFFKSSQPAKDDQQESVLHSLVDAKNAQFEGEFDTPTHLTCSLLRHQRQGLAWMVERERADAKTDSAVSGKGGILADDMGLGKTVQVIALLAHDLACDKPTLIVGPVAVLPQWEAEIASKTKSGTFPRVLVYHGAGKVKTSAVDIQAASIVISSYDTLAGKESPLLGVKYRRVILDEAHVIRNDKTAKAKACFSLESERRWCLTGTPMQNSPRDFFSLFKFIGVDPVGEKSSFERLIGVPYSQNPGDPGALKILDACLSRVLLRREKSTLDAQGRPLIEIPRRRDHLVKLEWTTSAEQEFYSHIMRTSRMAIKNSPLKAAHAALQRQTALLRLRQACDHPHLVPFNVLDMDAERPPKEATNLAEDVDDLADALGSVSLGGGEAFLGACKMCFAPISKSELCEKCAALRDGVPKMRVSTKMGKVLDLLTRDRKRKTIVFSQWTSLLDLLMPALEYENITYTRYDGHMTPKARSAALKAIAADDGPQVILMSLLCAAVGLNLTSCSQVILYDSWFNPAIEQQACDRVHRIGQKRPVDIYKLVIKDTVEDVILRIQHEKLRVADQTLRKNRVSKLASEDLIKAVLQDNTHA